MMACLSFFRTINAFRFDFLKNDQNFPPNNEKKFLKQFLDYLYIAKRFNIETQIIKNVKEKKKLYRLLVKEYDKQKKGHFYSKVFFALHFAFAKFHNKNINKKKNYSCL